MASSHLNLASVLEHPARLTPDAIAITCGPQHLTYAQLNAQASRMASALTRLGVAPGDRVVLSCPNIPWFPIAYFGILKAGAVVVPLNVLLKPPEIAYHLRDSGAKVMLAFEGTPELPVADMGRAACGEAGAQLFVLQDDLLRDAAPQFDSRAAHPDDTAVILYTSGTTGHPKGAELTHANMVTNAIVSHDMFRPAFDGGVQQNVTLITLPLFHSTGQTCQMNACLYGGFRLVLLPRFDAAAVLAAFSRERVGLWIGVPTMYWALLQYAKTSGTDASSAAASLRLCISGGAPMPVEVLHAFERTFAARVLEGYGLSETAPVVAFNQLHRPTKPGTVGLPIFGVEIRLVDDRDEPVAHGTPGEIVVRGPNVMKGYLNQPVATAEAMRGGWFHTGDIGVLDEEGYLTIVDRKKDMILRGGYNVYPREVEEVLITHPSVALCAVVGIPDPRMGEEVKGFVVRRAGADISAPELMAWCRERLATYKCPRHIEFRDALPIGATGKILKRELQAHP